MDEACIGSISELFDATQPFTPRGCIAQAWSVAEALRAWVRLGRVSREQDSSSSMALTLPR
jgi:glycogen debranching enzyme